MAKYLEFDYEFHDYRASYPTEQYLEMFDRGGEFAQDPSLDDQATIVDKCNEMNGLLTGALLGYSVIYQTDALHPKSRDIRDEILHQLGVIAGFDVHGEIEKNKISGDIVMANSDAQGLGISEEFWGVPLHVEFRSVQFGFIGEGDGSGTDWQVSEYEIPTAELMTNTDTGETYPKVLRVLSLSPLSKPE